MYVFLNHSNETVTVISANYQNDISLSYSPLIDHGICRETVFSHFKQFFSKCILSYVTYSEADSCYNYYQPTNLNMNPSIDHRQVSNEQGLGQSEPKSCHKKQNGERTKITKTLYKENIGSNRVGGSLPNSFHSATKTELNQSLHT